jgi:N utilization substance protein B
MTRTQEREQAFIMIFEKEFNTEVGIDELFSYAYETESFEQSLFTESLVKTAFEKLDEIDALIEKYSIGWKKARLPKSQISSLWAWENRSTTSKTSTASVARCITRACLTWVPSA